MTPEAFQIIGTGAAAISVVVAAIIVMVLLIDVVYVILPILEG